MTETLWVVSHMPMVVTLFRLVELVVVGKYHICLVSLTWL